MTIEWSLIVFITVIIVIFPLILLFSLRQYRTIKQVMEQQALKRNRTVEGSFLVPVLKLPYRTLPVVVTSVPGSKYRQAKTEIGITLQKPVRANLTIGKESLATRLGTALGATDVELGSEEFDREYVIKTQDDIFARSLLHFMLQQKLLEMKQEKPKIILEGTRLSVQVPRVVKTEEKYDRLFNLAFAFVDRLVDL
jgi:hypothetical protein